MKITFVSYVYPHPKRGFNHGIERVIENITQELARKGHEIHVITSYCRNQGEVMNEEVNGVMIHRIKDSRDLFGPMGSLLSLDFITLNMAASEFIRILEDSDIIHLFTPFWIRIPGIPIVSHFHHPEMIRSPKELLYLPSYRFLWRATYLRSDAVVSVSDYSSRYLKRIGIPDALLT